VSKKKQLESIPEEQDAATAINEFLTQLTTRVKELDETVTGLQGVKVAHGEEIFHLTNRIDTLEENYAKVRAELTKVKISATSHIAKHKKFGK